MQITRHGTPQQTVGTPPSLGHQLPAFSLTDANGKTVTTADFAGRYNLISVVPDINTREIVTELASVSTRMVDVERMLDRALFTACAAYCYARNAAGPGNFVKHPLPTATGNRRVKAGTGSDMPVRPE